MDPTTVRLILLLLGIAAAAVLATWLLSLPQRGTRHAVWKYIPSVLAGAAFAWALVRMAGADEGFEDLAWFLSALLALAAALPALIASLLLGRRNRRKTTRSG